MSPTGRFKLSRARGFSVMELLVGLALLGVVAGVAMSAAVTARSKAASQQMLAELAEIHSLIELTHRHRNDYTGLDGAALTPFLPESMRGVTSDGEEVIESIYGPVTAKPTAWAGLSNKEAYELQFTVPGKRECVAVGNALIGQWPYIQIRNEIIYWVSGTTAQKKPPTNMTVAGACIPLQGSSAALITLKKP